MLETLRIKGLKSIEEVELRLDALNVVIGPNGSGKSNLIGAFKLLERIVSKRLQLTVGEAGGADRFLFHGRKRTPEAELYFGFGSNAYDVTLRAAVGDTLILAKEGAHYAGYANLEDFQVRLASGSKESGLLDEVEADRGEVSKYVYREIIQWVVYHFHDTSDSAPSKQTGDVDDNRAFRADAGNLAAYLLMLKETSVANYQQIVHHIQLVAPFFEDFTLQSSRANSRKIKLEWRQKGSDAYFDAFSLSDGTLRFMCLATLLLQPKPPSLILLDEPELGLHPAAIQVLADMLKAASRKVQLLVATQSVTLLNQLSPENLIVAEHDGTRTSFTRLDDKIAPRLLNEWLEEYAIGELWEKNVLGGRPRG